MTNPEAGGAWVIDTRHFSERRTLIEGEIAGTSFPRFVENALQPFAPVKVRVEGVRSPRGKPGLRLSASCSIDLECQRCMLPVTLELAPLAAFELVEHENQLDVDDGDEWDMLVHSDHLELLPILEDELLLSLPYAPMHDDCSPAHVGDGSERTSPFAALVLLKGARAARGMK